MKRTYPVSRLALAIALVTAAAILVSCVRPLQRDESSELEYEETAVFEPTEEATTIPAEPTETPPLPTAEIQELPTQQPTTEPTVTPVTEVEPTPISFSLVITTPIEDSLLDVSTPIIIGGTGEGLPEGNVAVEVKDAEGNILAARATTLIGDNVGLGAAGTWELSVSLSADPGSQGSVYAFSTSPADGSVLAEDTVSVTFLPSVSQPFVEISSPVSDEVLPEGPILVTGLGGGLFEGTVVVQVEDQAGDILLTQPTILEGENVGIGGSGTWEVSLSLSVLFGSPIRIVAFSTSPEDGAVIASASVDVVYGDSANQIFHLVQPGENLYRISSRYGVSMEAIMLANGITNADYIYAGQYLIIPVP